MCVQCTQVILITDNQGEKQNVTLYKQLAINFYFAVISHYFYVLFILQNRDFFRAYNTPQNVFM